MKKDGKPIFTKVDLSQTEKTVADLTPKEYLELEEVANIDIQECLNKLKGERVKIIFNNGKIHLWIKGWTSNKRTK